MSFDYNGTSSRLVSTNVISGMPLTMACWFNPDNMTAEQTLMCMANPTNLDYYSLMFDGAAAGDPVAAKIEDGATVYRATSTTGATSGTWAHACGVWNSTTSRSAFINGGSKGTNTSSISAPTDMQYVEIGVTLWNNSLIMWFDGRIAEVAMWNAALTDDEVASLGKGFSPLLIRPQSLALYIPSLREDDDIKTGIGVSNIDTTVADHPRIILPQ